MFGGVCYGFKRETQIASARVRGLSTVIFYGSVMNNVACFVR